MITLIFIIGQVAEWWHVSWWFVLLAMFADNIIDGVTD